MTKTKEIRVSNFYTFDCDMMLTEFVDLVCVELGIKNLIKLEATENVFHVEGVTKKGKRISIYQTGSFAGYFGGYGGYIKNTVITVDGKDITKEFLEDWQKTEPNTSFLAFRVDLYSV